MLIAAAAGLAALLAVGPVAAKDPVKPTTDTIAVNAATATTKLANPTLVTDKRTISAHSLEIATKVKVGDPLKVMAKLDKPLPKGWTLRLLYDLYDGKPRHVLATCKAPKQACLFSTTVPETTGTQILVLMELKGTGRNEYWPLGLVLDLAPPA